MLNRGRARRRVILLLAVAVGVPAESWAAGVGTAAAATPTDAGGGRETDPDHVAVPAQAEAPWGIDPATRDRFVAGIGAELELDVAEQSGLAEALGGRDAAAVALAQAWAPAITTVTTTLGAEESFGAEKPSVVLASLLEAAPESPNIGEGMFGGYMMVALGAKGAVTYSNDLPDGKPVSGPLGDSKTTTVDLSPERARMTVETPYDQDGLKTQFKATVDVAPCPTADGTFEASATIDVSATKGSVGQNGTLEIRLTGQVDDDAKLASSTAEYRMQWRSSGARRDNSST